MVCKRRCFIWRKSVGKYFSCSNIKTFSLILLTAAVCCFIYLQVTKIEPWQEKDFVKYRKSRSLHYYLNTTKTLIEPSISLCPNWSESDLVFIAAVVSAPMHERNRAAIRETWGPHFKTIFFVAAKKSSFDSLWLSLSNEAKKYNDMVIFDFVDHYQILTIKNGLMMNWVSKQCPHTNYTLSKLDDDLAVNPWKLKELIRADDSGKTFMGNLHKSHHPLRSVYDKWYVPRWINNDDWTPGILACVYIVKGRYLKDLLDATKVIPMHSVEDIYYTEVARKKLKLKIIGNKRLYGIMYYINYLNPACYFFCHKAIYGENNVLNMRVIWAIVAKMGERYEEGKAVCEFCTDN